MGLMTTMIIMICALVQENLFAGFANNKSTDQPSLISTFVIRLLERIISKLVSSKIPLF